MINLLSYEQIKDLMRKAIGIEVSVFYLWNESSRSRFIATANSSKRIVYINPNAIIKRKFSKSAQNGFILHEAAHILLGHKNRSSENEYDAQIWAIAKSKEMGMKKVESYLVSQFRSWGKPTGGVKEYKIYYDAYKMGVRNKLIKRRR